MAERLDMDIMTLPTPCYLVDEALLLQNLECLKGVADETGAKILLAQKAFSMYRTYPLIGKYLNGTAASGLYEARLGREEMGKEGHCYRPAYPRQDMDELIKLCDHMVFNTPSQWVKYRDIIRGADKKISCGLRVNPEYAEVETELYNPCAKGSRLGTTLDNLQNSDLEGLEGLHFHTMCEQNSDVLKRTIQVVDKKFSHLLKHMKWINFGGGHHITRKDYDINALKECIAFFQEKYNLTVYLEPGEAVALNAGFLISEVLETMHNGIDIAILDTSAACHMPDVLEMPYRPQIIGAGEKGEKPYTVRLGGPTCLSGDIIGDYSFDRPVQAGDRLIFCDMAIYSMVKNNTFNGMKLPSILYRRINGKIEIVKQFSYEDFKRRLS